MDLGFSFDLKKFHISPPQEKSDHKFGEYIAESLLNARVGSGGFFQERNKRIDFNERFIKGNQPMNEYMDMLNIDGKKSYISIDTKPPKIAPKFYENTIARFMERNEKPTIQAVDNSSKEEKEKAKSEAYFMMTMGGQVAELEQGAGIPLADRSQYIPEDDEDLDSYFTNEYQSEKERDFEVKISNVLADNKYEQWKRRMLGDIFKSGFSVTKVSKDETGRIKIRACVPKSIIHSYSTLDDFSDCSTIGEVRRFKISQLRVQYPQLSEATLFTLYKSASNDHSMLWDEIYQHSLIRPYDDISVEVFEFQIITSEPVPYLQKITKSGKTIVFNKSSEQNYSGQKTKLQSCEVVYEGVYCISAKKMIKWQLQKDMIKPHWDLGEVFGSYCVVMPNNDGEVPEAIAERMITPIRGMTLAHLKIQQVLAKMRPDGLIIAIDGMDDIDLGEGVLSPLQLQEVFDQTGIQYYRRTDDDGETQKSPPIMPTETHNSVSKLQSLINSYNFYLNQLRDSLGTNEYTEGQSVNPKLGLGVMQNQVSNSNRSTENIYSAFINMLEQVATRISVLEWYNIMNESDNPEAKTIYKNAVFDLEISMLPTDSERQFIEAIIERDITAGNITSGAAFKARRLAKVNLKTAENYLAKYEKKRLQESIQQNQANIQATARAQQQSNQQTHDNAMLLKGAEYQGEVQKQEVVSKMEETKDLSRFIQSVILEMIKQGKPVESLPPFIQPLAQSYFDNVLKTQELQSIGKSIEMQQVAAALQQQDEAA